ncbi:transposase-like protein [Paraburkholderia sp. CI3]
MSRSGDSEYKQRKIRIAKRRRILMRTKRQRRTQCTATGSGANSEGESIKVLATKHQGKPPKTITLDGYAASHRAVREMKADVEQDHRHIKSRTNVMLGFNRFRNAAITLAGIELTHRIRKGQFNLTKLGLKDTAAPAVWNAVLSAR